MKRIFFAILLKKEEQERIEEAINEIKKTTKGHFTKASNLHITFEFIGEVSEEFYRRALNILKAIPRTDIILLTSGFHLFNTHSSKQVLTLKIEDNNALNELVRKLHHQLDIAGIPYTKRQFTPHITLARKFEGSLPLDFQPTIIEVEHMSLMETVHETDGLTYLEKGRN